MGKFAITWEKGRNTVDAETSLPNGFLTTCTGFIYLPDSFLLHKIPGAAEVHDLPSGATNANTVGLAAIKLRSHSYLLAATDGKLSSAAFGFEDPDSTDSASPIDNFDDWVDLQDQQSTAADFPFTGRFFKAIPDGRNRWVAWSGSESERALVLDEDMTARMLSLRKPDTLVWPTPGSSSTGLVTNPAGITVTFRPDENNTTFTNRTGTNGDFTWMSRPYRNTPSAGSGNSYYTNPWILIHPKGSTDDSDWTDMRFRMYYPVRTEQGYYVRTFGSHTPLEPAKAVRSDFGTPPSPPGDDDFAKHIIGGIGPDVNQSNDEVLTDPAAFSTDPEVAYDGSSTTYTEKTNVTSDVSPFVELSALETLIPRYTSRRVLGRNDTLLPTFDGVQDSERAKRLVAVGNWYSGIDGIAIKAWWIRYAVELQVYSVEYGFSTSHAQKTETTEDHILVLDVAGVVNGAEGILPTEDNPTPWGEGPGSGKGMLTVEVSYNSTVGNIPTVAFQKIARLPVGFLPRTEIQFSLSDLTGISGAADIRNLVVRISFVNGDPLSNSNSGVRIYDVKVQRDDAAGAGNIPQGTYWYTHTEVLTKTLSDETSIITESAPSTPVSIVVDADTYNGVKFNIPARKNIEEYGVANDDDVGQVVTYNVYRTTKSGAYPDLGDIGSKIAPADVTSTTLYVDSFSTSGAILGTPTINTVTSGSDTVNAAGEAPPIRDATLYRGSLVVIPANSPYELAWSMPGAADSFPNPSQRLKLLPSERNDELMGVLALNDVLVVFMQTRTVRLRELPFAGQSDYNLTRIERDVLSPNEGLAGTPMAYTTFEIEDGRSMAAWISHNGIWMTDGSLVTERGMGCVKITRYMDWNNTVSLPKLNTARLFYDPILQALMFDFVDTDGNQKIVCFHTAALHWLPTGKDQTVPKWTGPHPTAYNGYGRTLVERNGQLRHYFAQDGDVYRMANGTQAGGADIISYAETGFVYPSGPDGIFHVYDGTLEHTSWAREDQCTVEVTVRNDESGDVMHETISDLPLGGARQSNFWINMAGQAMKLALRHDGKTTSLTTPIRAFKTLQADGEVASDNAEQ